MEINTGEQSMAHHGRQQILLIDDDISFCELVEKYLEREGFMVDQVHNGVDAVGRVLSNRHDVAILDIMLPGLGGIEILRKVRIQSQIPVMMVTARCEEVDRIIGLEVGADDYLPKPFNPRELVARLRALLRRARLSEPAPPDHPTSVVVGEIELNSRARGVRKKGSPIPLTTAEFDLLQVLMGNAGTIVPRDDLARVALGRPFAPFERSVDLHMSHLRRKLGPAPDGSERIKTVRGVGYIYAVPA